jgi:riboflavin kinase/FMN adenylyltransferase
MRGDGRGRSLGFPTANLRLESAETFPAHGIYAGWAQLASAAQRYQAVLHIGPRPTLPDAAATIEVHLLDFPDRDLYGETITVDQLVFLRPIKKFDTLEALSAAIAEDCKQARKLLKAKNKRLPTRDVL